MAEEGGEVKAGQSANSHPTVFISLDKFRARVPSVFQDKAFPETINVPIRGYDDTSQTEPMDQTCKPLQIFMLCISE